MKSFDDRVDEIKQSALGSHAALQQEQARVFLRLLATQLTTLIQSHRVSITYDSASVGISVLHRAFDAEVAHIAFRPGANTEVLTVFRGRGRREFWSDYDLEGMTGPLFPIDEYMNWPGSDDEISPTDLHLISEENPTMRDLVEALAVRIATCELDESKESKRR